jgi:hypothetical protein
VTDNIITDPKEIKRLQRGLKEQQFDPGPVDGILGSWTQKAIDFRKQSFQKDVPEDITQRLLAIAVRQVGRISKSKSNALFNRSVPADQASKTQNKWRYNVNFILSCFSEAMGPESPSVSEAISSKQLLEPATWTHSAGGIPPSAGDVFGVYFNSIAEVAHSGLILEWPKTDKFFLTVEAAHNDNYWPGNDGWPRICMRRRLKTDAFAVRKFL